MTPSNKKQNLYIHLDEELTDAIDKAIELEQEQLQLDPNSNKWLAIQDELAERIQEIGDMIIWEYRQLPF